MAKKLVQSPAQAGSNGAWALDPALPLNSSAAALLAVDAEGRILGCNRPLAVLLGCEARELLGSSVHDVLPGLMQDLYARRSPQGSPPANATRLITALLKDGSSRQVIARVSPLRTATGKLMLITLRDAVSVDDRDQADLLVELRAEEERNRIGMDLHDGIMQEVYAIGLTLEMALYEIEDERSEARRSLERAIDQLHDVIGDIRSYIFDLRPRDFRGDLGSALKELAKEFQQNSHIATSCDLCDAVSAIPPELGVGLYSIAHESLSNVRKHARASAVSISVKPSDDGFLFEVTDDGCGFDADSTLPQSHRGMRNMATRAKTIGGTFEVASAISQGTTVRVRLPVHAAASFVRAA